MNKDKVYAYTVVTMEGDEIKHEEVSNIGITNNGDLMVMDMNNDAAVLFAKGEWRVAAMTSMKEVEVKDEETTALVAV